MRVRAAVAGWLFVLAAGAALAQPGPLDRTELDKRTARVVYDGALLGSELFNKGNHEGCFRLYQGTLMAVQPLLDHRPKLALFVKEQLDKAAAMRAVDGSFELRKALDAVQEQTAEALGPTKGMPPPKGAPTALWDRLGGEKTVRAAVKDFIQTAGADAKLNLSRGGKYKLDGASTARMEQWLVEAVSQGTGGPLKGAGKELAAFAGEINLTTPEVNGLAIHFLDALEKNKVAEAERNEVLLLMTSLRSKGAVK